MKRTEEELVKLRMVANFDASGISKDLFVHACLIKQEVWSTLHNIIKNNLGSRTDTAVLLPRGTGILLSINKIISVL